MQMTGRNGTRAATLAMVVLLGLFAARTMAAAVTAFDFTGQWVGNAQEGANPPVGVTATLMTASGRKFTGTLTVAGTPALTCHVTGKEKPNLKVKVHLTCDDKSAVALRGTLDVQARTVAGTYTRTTKHGKHRQGTFTLAKQGP